MFPRGRFSYSQDTRRETELPFCGFPSPMRHRENFNNTRAVHTEEGRDEHNQTIRRVFSHRRAKIKTTDAPNTGSEITRPPLTGKQKKRIDFSILLSDERKTGFEPATPTLARWCSTTELFPHFFLFFSSSPPLSPSLFFLPPSSSGGEKHRAENGIRTRDPHLGKVVLYH